MLLEEIVVDGRQVKLVGDPAKLAYMMKIATKTLNLSTPDEVLRFNIDWRARRDSNSRHPGSKPGTLSS
jgi:hypothetical protein